MVEVPRRYSLLFSIDWCTPAGQQGPAVQFVPSGYTHSSWATLSLMADWSPLRRALGDVERCRTFTWQELDALVGGLPASAFRHPAFWKGARTGWPGFTTTEVVVGQSVTFVRSRASSGGTPSDGLTSVEAAAPTPQLTERGTGPVRRADIVLVGCAKSKLSHAAPAKDLYTSPLFRTERAYAEATGGRWFILSAQHGLVTPDEVLEPYDLRLATTQASYRQDWGARVVKQLQDACGPLAGKTVEVHAGSAYVQPIRGGLVQAGARVVEPLAGLTLGGRLAWYSSHGRRPPPPASSPAGAPAESIARDATRLVDQLRGHTAAQTPAEFLATNGAGTRMPGLYSWWVDSAGARDLTAGLGHSVEPGLIYAGLAGATRSRSGRKSTNTLWGRIRGMHLGGRYTFSTFRLSLGSILAAPHDHEQIDEESLTAWMHQHLRVIAIPVEDADTLDSLETGVLGALDPPLNLDKRPKNELRASLSVLRRQHKRR